MNSSTCANSAVLCHPIHTNISPLPPSFQLLSVTDSSPNRQHTYCDDSHTAVNNLRGLQTLRLCNGLAPRRLLESRGDCQHDINYTAFPTLRPLLKVTKNPIRWTQPTLEEAQYIDLKSSPNIIFMPSLTPLSSRCAACDYLRLTLLTYQVYLRPKLQHNPALCMDGTP